MIIGYLCSHCQGVADKVIMAKFTKDDVDLHLGYVCDECKDPFYEAHRKGETAWMFADWTLTFDITDIKSVDLLHLYGHKEKVHKKF